MKALWRFLKKLEYRPIGSILSNYALKKWLNELPIFDMVKTYLELITYLKKLNQQEIPGKRCFTQLKLIYPTMKQLSDLLASQKALTKSDTMSERAYLYAASQLHGAYADSWRECIFHHGSNGPSAARLEAINYALSSYLEYLILNYRLKELLPEQFWQNVYYLYRELKKIGTQDNNATHVFKAILLLSISGPYQLTKAKIDAVKRIALVYADDLYLSEHCNEKAVFAFNEQGKAPPSHITNLTKSQHDMVYIELHHFSRCLSKLDKLSSDFRDKLQQIWLGRVQRQFQRQREQGQVNLVRGLLGLYRAIIEIAPNGQITDDFIPYDGDENSGYILNSESDNRLVKQYNQHIYSIKEGLEKTPSESWRLVDASEGGFRLVNELDYPVELLESQSLIGIYLPDANNYQSAIVRWVKVNPQHAVELGASLIAKLNQTVFMQNERQKIHHQHSPAIIAYDSAYYQKKELLITLALSYQVGDKVYIIRKDKQYPVLLQSCIEEAVNYRIFTFKWLADELEKPCRT